MIIFIKKGGFIAAGRLNALFRKTCGLFCAKKRDSRIRKSLYCRPLLTLAAEAAVFSSGKLFVNYCRSVPNPSAILIYRSDG